MYHVARAVLKYLGRVDLGGMVADRAMRYAEEVEDPLLIAAATWNLGDWPYLDASFGQFLNKNLPRRIRGYFGDRVRT